MNGFAAAFGVLGLTYCVFHFAAPKGMKNWVKQVATFRDANPLPVTGLNLLFGTFITYHAFNPTFNALNLLLGVMFFVRAFAHNLVDSARKKADWFIAHWNATGLFVLLFSIVLLGLGIAESMLAAYLA